MYCMLHIYCSSKPGWRFLDVVNWLFPQAVSDLQPPTGMAAEKEWANMFSIISEKPLPDFEWIPCLLVHLVVQCGQQVHSRLWEEGEGASQMRCPSMTNEVGV